MPSRIIREGIISSERVNKLSDRAEVFYRRLMSAVDDYGRFYAHLSILRTACYPLRLDIITEADVKPLLDECIKAELIGIYNAGKHLFLKDFKQQTRSKSKFPEPTQDELLIKCKSNVNQMPSVFGVAVVVEDVVGVGVEKEGRRGYPTLDEVKTRAQMTGLPESEAIAFWNHFESSGWIDRHGHKIMRWESKMDNWKVESRAQPYESAHKNGSTSKGRPLSVLDLKNIIEAKRSLANQLKVKYSSEVAMGTTWSDTDRRKEFYDHMKEIRKLETQIAQMA